MKKPRVLRKAPKPETPVHRATPEPDAKPAKGKGNGKGKPNFHQKAKAAGIDLRAPEIETPEIVCDLPEPGESHGRPTCLTPELGSRVCTLYAQRNSLEQIEEIDGMPAARTVYRWLAGGEGKNSNTPLYDAFRQAFARAKELRAHTRTDAIEDYLDRLTNPNRQDKLDSKVARVAIDGQRALMELENRKDYGRQLTLKGDPKNPLVPKTPYQLSKEDLMAIAAGGLAARED